MKLSVLITYYNEGPWLTDCLQSVLPQLAADDEVIIYDDASHTPAQAYLPDDARVRLLRGNTNVGPAGGRNELIAASTGTHIHFHDADDLFAAAWRKSVVSVFALSNADVVFTDVASFDEAGDRSQHVMQISQLRSDGDLLKFALRGSMLAPSGTYTKELVQRVGGYRFDLWQSEDYDFHVRVALANPRFAIADGDLVLIRRHGNQRSRRLVEVWTGALQSLETLQPRIPANARAHAAHAATRAGSVLFASGAHPEAARAFALAERFGGVRYDRRVMQRLTQLVGAATAERLAAWYRAIVPNGVRARLQRLN